MAKIVEVRASAHSCPLENYRACLSLGTNTKRDIVLLRIADESIADGFGEAHHGQHPTDMATVIQDGLGSLIIGADSLDSEGIRHRLERQQIVTHGLGADYGIEIDEAAQERYPAIPGPCYIPGWAGG